MCYFLQSNASTAYVKNLNAEMLGMQQSYIAFGEISPNLKQFVGGGGG